MKNVLMFLVHENLQTSHHGIFSYLSSEIFPIRILPLSDAPINLHLDLYEDPE